MASADFSASSFRRYRRPWPFRADGEISRNKTHFFRPAGCGFTTLLRLGLGLRLVLQTCPQVGLVSAFCAYPPNFASDFLHPRPRGRKLVLGYLVPPNWPIGDFHSRPCVMSCVHKEPGPAEPILVIRDVAREEALGLDGDDRRVLAGLLGDELHLAVLDSVKSRPQPTLAPGWIFVPRWRTMMEPALRSWPS